MAVVFSTGDSPNALPSFAEPGISPDGREIAFVSAGDIWTVPAEGGEARLLVAHEAYESRPLYAPDGRRLAFVSKRTGGGDIYILDFASGALRRLTFDDGLEQLDGWSRDGQWIYFSSTSHDISGMNDIYRVRATGGSPMPVSDDRYVNEFSAAVSPDGRTLAFSARGNSSNQWWRRGHSHLDMSELWTVPLDGDASKGRAYTQLTARNGKSSWPMWSADGGSLFFMSDRDGAENLWWRAAAPGGNERKLTAFTGGRLLWPSISNDGHRIAFEREFGIWTIDVEADGTAGAAKPVTIARRGAVTGPDTERLRSTSQFNDLALSPDGKKIALVSRGEIFAAGAREGGDAARVTFTTGIESSPVWAPDSRRLAYVSTREGEPRIYLHDFATGAERALTAGGGDRGPAFSPDGTKLAFVRNRRELRVVDVDARGTDPAKHETKLAEGLFGDSLDTGGASWSPDGRWLAIFGVGAKSFTNVQLVPAAGGAPRPVSYVSNVFSNTINWGRDGTYLLFDTRQRTESGQLARVDLVLRTPRFREDQFRDLFTPPARPAPAEPKPATPPAEPAVDLKATKPEPAKPVEPVFDDIRRRLSLLPVSVDVLTHAISPDGKSAVLIAGAEGHQNLYLYPLDELAETQVARQLTTTVGQKADAQFSPDGKDIFYLDAGRVQIVNVERREARPVAITAEMSVNFEEEKQEVFRQAWTLMRDNFYDPKFHGVDWSESRDIFAPRISGAGSADEMRRLINLMIGDLNASHLGMSSPGGGGPLAGKLGLGFDRAEYERTGLLRVSEVVALGPAAVTREVRTGDYLLAIDGDVLGAGVNLDERLQHKINRRVMLRVSSSADGAKPREVAVRPINQAGEKNLRYRAWVESNREYVLKQSGGRLGYVHMFSMGAAQLEQLYMDLDAENHARDGVVIDIRNNNGGFVNVYAIDVLSRQPYLRMSTRGLPESSGRTVLGQRALEAPTVLVTNQHSLSDAEDFAEGYRTLKLGQIVGEPTSGWIIYTWNTQLLDGSGFRLPRMRVTGADGANMELNPRPVDVPVTRPIGESKSGKDSQLDTAIAVLLKKLGAKE